MTTQPVYIVDIVEAIVAKVRANVLAKIIANETAVLGQSGITTINYQYGHFRELLETLAQWDANVTLRAQKYPLVYLVTDFKEKRGRQAGVYADTNLRVIVCHQTDPTYKSTDRKAKVFAPVLYPIYLELIEQFAKSDMTMAGSADLVLHDKTDRYYWGTSTMGGNVATSLNDYVDAIEIENLQAKFDYQPCFP